MAQVREITDELRLVSDDDKPMVAELSDEVASLARLLELIEGRIVGGQRVPERLAFSATLHVEMSQEAAQEAAEHAEGELSRTLGRVLRRLGWAGRKLLSMNLHLLPVKEWTLEAEVSAVVLKGRISVTFGK
jgi:hypothetical protein